MFLYTNLLCVKKRLLSIILFTLSLNAFSQLNKGGWLIGGNGTFSYSRANHYNQAIKYTSFTFSPTGGYFILNRLAGGLRTDLGSETRRYGNIYKTRNIFLSAGPFFRYYFLSSEQKINLFAEAGYGFSYGKYTNFSSPDYKYHFSTFSFKTGPAVFLNKHTALEVTVGYNHSTRGPIDTVVTNTIQLGIGLQIHFGKTKNKD